MPLSTLRAAWPGLVLLLCAAFLLKFRLDLQPLLGIPPNPETPNLARHEIDSHLIMLVGLALLSAAGGLLALALPALTRRVEAGSVAAVRGAGWVLRAATLGSLLYLLWLYGRTVLARGVTEGGEQGFMLLGLSVLVGLPLLALTWTALSRLDRWATLAMSWTGTPPGGLYRRARELSAPWGLIAALLFGAGLWLLPVALMDLPHPKAHTVSTLLDKTVIAQQKPLQLLAMLSLLSAGTSAWFLRRALVDTTAELDHGSSRIGTYLEGSGA